MNSAEERNIWHKLRGENIGGSEIAVLFGESSYMTYYELWHIKHGYLSSNSEDLENSERIQAGQFLEAGAINWFNHLNGTAFYQPHQYFLHKTVKGAGCTPDAVEPNGERIAQVKNVDSLIFLKKWEAEDKTRTIINAPIEIELQCQYELEICDVEENILIVVVGGNRLYSKIIKRDREVGKILVDAVSKFWNLTTPPEPDFERDEETVFKLRKEMKLKAEEDLSENKYLYNLCKKSMALTLKKRLIDDELRTANTEIAFLVGNSEMTKCKKLFIKLPSNKKTPQIISQEEIY